MAKFVGLLLCLALIHAGHALQCYNCVSNPMDKNCDEASNKDNLKVATCGKAASANYQEACIKKVIEDKNTKVINTTRQCIILKKDNEMTEDCKPSSTRFDVLSCDICKDDLCNGSEQYNMNMFTMIGSIVTYLVVKMIY